jgi:hypothetical protein
MKETIRFKDLSWFLKIAVFFAMVYAAEFVLYFIYGFGIALNWW